MRSVLCSSKRETTGSQRLGSHQNRNQSSLSAFPSFSPSFHPPCVLHSEFISFTSTSSPLLYPSTCYLPHHFLYLCLYFLSSVCFTNLPSFPKVSPLLPSLLLVSISTCTLVSYSLSPSKRFLIIAYLFSFRLCYYPTCLLPEHTCTCPSMSDGARFHPVGDTAAARSGQLHLFLPDQARPEDHQVPTSPEGISPALGVSAYPLPGPEGPALSRMGELPPEGLSSAQTRT